MGWAFCGKDDLGRDIGYGVQAVCDEKGCKTEIDRGLGCVCGGMHGGNEVGCGRYFCGKHLFMGSFISEDGNQLCKKCNDVWFEENKAEVERLQRIEDGEEVETETEETEN